MLYKITQQEADIIRSVAQKASGHRSVKLEPGSRINVNNHLIDEVNIALISDDPDWADTDLFDHVPWAEFRKGLKLTEDGRGIVDIYVYEVGGCQELLCNITAIFAGGKLARVEGERIVGNRNSYFESVSQDVPQGG